MKKLSKIALVLLVLVLASASVFAAGGKEQATKGGEVKLGVWPEDNKPEEIKTHENVYVPALEAKYPNIKVTPQYYKYAVDSFVALAESGNAPTVFETWYTEPQKLIKNGLIADVTAQVKEKGILDAINPDIRALLSDENGNVYGVPRDAYALGMMVNVEIFEEAGLVDANGYPLVPKTFAELGPIAKQIREKTGSAGLVLLAKDNAGGWHFSNIAWNYGAEFMHQDASGKWIATIDTPEVLEAYKAMYDLKWTYNAFTDDPLTEDWGTGFAKLGSGAAAMYIAANDAVNMPTEVNGLAVDKLGLYPIPAGTKGQYALMGGTPYVFSKDATAEELKAALDYLEIMGKLPIMTAETLNGLEESARRNKEYGTPIIPRFPAWTSEEYAKAEAAANARYANVDMGLYNDYYNLVAEEGHLKLEEPQATQDLYAELTKVLQAVVTDKNVNIKALLATAQSNFQQLLDTDVNK